MSDKIRKLIGIIMILVSVIFCSIPLLLKGRIQQIDYKTGDNAFWRLISLQPEKHGEICINTADAEELTRIPGVGETISSMIIAERDMNGPYFYPEDLIAVRGIGPVSVSKIRDLIDLRID